MTSEDAPPRVFLIYAHHPEAVALARVSALASRLYAGGVDVRWDRIDPAADAGWPSWTEHQLQMADKVLLVCSAPFRDRFAGQLDDHGGHGVAWEGHLIRSLAYRKRDFARYVPVVFEGMNPDDVVPLFLAQQRHFVLDGEYDELLKALGPRSPTANEAPVTRPLLEVATHDLVLLARDPHSQSVTALAARLSANRVAPIDDPEGDSNRARIVVCVDGDDDRGRFVRIENAEDRALVTGRDEGDLVAGVKRARASLSARWWTRAGAPLGVGALGAALAPALWARAFERSSALTIALFCLFVIGAGFGIVAGLQAASKDGGLVVAPGRRAWPLAWRSFRNAISYTVSAGGGAVGRVRWSIAAAAYLMAWGWFFGRHGAGLSPYLRPLAVMGALAIAFGVASLLAVRARPPWRWFYVVAIAWLALRIPNVELGWSILGDPNWRETLRALLQSRAASPSAWVLAAPALAPLTVGSAGALAFVCIRFLPRRIGLQPTLTAAIGGTLMAVSLAGGLR
jgi:hypothetical protein